MKRIRTCIAIACCTSASIISCSKESNSSSTESFDVNIGAGQCYTYDLGSFANHESASITTRPKRSDSSILNRNATGDRIGYKYCPNKAFLGIDEAVITSTRNSAPEITVTTIRYTISK